MSDVSADADTARGPVADRLPAPLRSAWANDLVKIGTTLGAVYALYVGIGVVLGYGLSGQLNSLRRLTFLIVLYSVGALVVNLHWGYSGLFNIGVVGFMAVGVYTTTILTRPVAGQNPTGTLPGLGLPFPVAVAGGVLAATAVGYVAALPSLRLRDDYFAIVTLAFAEIIRITVKASELQEFTLFGVTMGTGGGRGIRTFPNPVDQFFAGPGQPVVAAVSRLGVDGSLVSGWAFVLALTLLLAAVYWLIVRLAGSPFGRVLRNPPGGARRGGGRQAHGARRPERPHPAPARDGRARGPTGLLRVRRRLGGGAGRPARRREGDGFGAPAGRPRESRSAALSRGERRLRRSPASSLLPCRPYLNRRTIRDSA